MLASISRILTLFGLLITAGWVATSPKEWEPWTVLIFTFAVYIVIEIRTTTSHSMSESADHVLFRKLLKDLPSNGSIAFIRNANMDGFSFSTGRLIDLDNFWHEWDDADHEFQNTKLEQLRKKLFLRASCKTLNLPRFAMVG